MMQVDGERLREAGWDVDDLERGWVADRSNGVVATTVAVRGDVAVLSLEDEASGLGRDFRIARDERWDEHLACVLRWQPGLTPDNFRGLASELATAGADVAVRIDGEWVPVTGAGSL